MYDFKLNKNEKILLISDNTKILNKDNEYTSIITTDRLLILDYPTSYHNSMEELRIIGRMNYIKMKEPIFETKLKDIKNITSIDNYTKVTFQNNTSITIKDDEIINLINQFQ